MKIGSQQLEGWLATKRIQWSGGGGEKGVNPCPAGAGYSRMYTSNSKNPAGASVSRDGGQASVKSGRTA